MNEVYQAAAEMESFCRDRGWKFCFIGGLAVQRWSDPRQTEDADLTLLTGFGGEDVFIEALLAEFNGRYPDERSVAALRRVVFLEARNGVAIDIALGGFPFEANSIERATPWRIDRDIVLTTCSADDLIVHKAFASRDIDWADVTGIIMRQGRKLKVEQIWDELRPLVELKEEPEILTRLQKIFDAHLD